MIRFKDLVTNSALRNQIRVVDFSSFVYINNSENWRFSLHSHQNFCELIYIVSGEGTYIVDTCQYFVKEGDLVLINKDVSHVQISNPENPLTLWNLSIHLSASDELGENMILPDDWEPVLPCKDIKAAVEECCQEIFREMTNRSDNYEAMCIWWAERYLLLVKRLLNAEGKRILKRKNSLVEEIKQYIDKHYMEDITLNCLAVEFHASKYYIAHQMKNEYGTSPINYLIDKRLGEAQNLLNTTSKSITEVAALVGYENSNYFNKIFNKKVGMNPSEFRALYVNIGKKP